MAIQMRTYHSIRAVKKHWEALLAGKMEEVSPYIRYDFQRLFSRCERLKMWKKRQRAAIFVFYSENKPIAILPMKTGKCGSRRVLYFLADRTIVGELDGIFSPDLSEEQFTECMEIFCEAVRGDQIVFNKLSEHSRLYQYFCERAEKTEIVCVNIPFAEGYEPYYHALRKSVRQNIRTAYNRLNTDGKSLTFVYVEGKRIPHDLQTGFQTIHLERCSERGYGSRMTESDMRRSKLKKHFDVIERGTDALPNNFVSAVKIDGEVAAYLAGFTNRDTLVVPRLAIVTSLGKYSPGILLLNETIKHFSAAETVCNIDLSTGDEPYKLSMGGECYSLWKLSFTV